MTETRAQALGSAGGGVLGEVMLEIGGKWRRSVPSTRDGMFDQPGGEGDWRSPPVPDVPPGCPRSPEHSGAACGTFPGEGGTHPGRFCIINFGGHFWGGFFSRKMGPKGTLPGIHPGPWGISVTARMSARPGKKNYARISTLTPMRDPSGMVPTLFNSCLVVYV